MIKRRIQNPGMKTTVSRPYLAAGALLSFVGSSELFTTESKKDAYKAIRIAIPWMERTKGGIWRAFLEGPMTVHDMMRRLGKRRPGDIYKMMCTFTLAEARTGYFIDEIEKLFDVLVDVTMVPLEKTEAIRSLSNKIRDRDPESLTEEESAVMTRLMKDSTKRWPRYD